MSKSKDYQKFLTIEKEIVRLLETNTTDAHESIMVLGHLLYCSSISLKIDPQLMFLSIAKHFISLHKNNVKEITQPKLRF